MPDRAVAASCWAIDRIHRALLPLVEGTEARQASIIDAKIPVVEDRRRLGTDRT